MERLFNRLPFLFLCVAMALGAYLGLAVDVSYGEVAFGLGLLVSGLFFWRLSRFRVERYVDYLFLLLVFGFFLFGEAFNSQSQKPHFVDSEETCRLECRVVRVHKREAKRLMLFVEADTLVGKTVRASNVKGMLRVAREAEYIICGSRLSVVGRIKRPWVDKVSGYDYGEYLRSQGCSFYVYGDSVRVLQDDGFSLSAIVGKVQEWFDSRLRAIGISERNVGFLRGLVLADRSQMDGEIREAFSACGTSHVLAVSGLHVGVISTTVVWLLGLFLKQRWRFIIAIALVWAYALLTGLPTSVVRAAIMFSFLHFVYLLQKNVSSYQSLCVAFFLILLFDPLAVVSCGFWLSFMAVGGLLYVFDVYSHRDRDRDKKESKAKAWLIAASIASLTGQVFTLPISLYVFHMAPLYFWVNNLVVIPAMSVMLIGVLVCVVLAFVPYVGVALGYLLERFISLVIGYCSFMGGLPGAVVRDIPFDRVAMYLLYVVLFFFCLYLRRRTLNRLLLFVSVGLLFGCYLVW